MDYKLTLLLALSAAALAFSQSAGAQIRDVETPQVFASFEMTRPVARPQEVALRASRAAEAMLGARVASPAAAAVVGRTEEGAGRSRLTLAQLPSLDVQYLADYDELRLVNRDAQVAKASGTAIGKERALDIAKRAFDELASRQLIDARHYDWRRADVASTWVGGGPVRGNAQAQQQLVEYRITLRRVINGIELANAGLRIAVGVDGQLSSLRLGGVSVASVFQEDREVPAGAGVWHHREVVPAQLQQRIERELAAQGGTPKVAWSRVMYVMPENQRSAVVAPMYVVSYSLAVPSGTGQTVVSRRMTVGYSLTDAQAQAVDLTPPARAVKADEVVKQ
ncbi:hypothetical protein OOT46_08825 [Aquabacterium sp. A7-Y]|uniref:hypothetical protein n=1 Tax=Aquabacterium sp. A7-Y TaxID=1349605 RepID=UPI00223DA9E6|nr:hypothetical protein [Aquabacterium sp. A7-Y]MCW7537952.1 hypothetical protein [Aquabacterium sp. A7-Y]